MKIKIYCEVGLVGQKARKGKFGHVFLLVSLTSRFSKYFREAVSDKYKSITNPFDADLPQNYDFSLLKKKTIVTLYPTLLSNCIFPESHT
jgi:hypothetical protein